MELKVDMPSLAGQDIDPETFQRVWNRVMPDQAVPRAQEGAVSVPDTAVPAEPRSPSRSSPLSPTARPSRSAPSARRSRSAPPAPSAPPSQSRCPPLRRPPSAWGRHLRRTADGWRR